MCSSFFQKVSIRNSCIQNTHVFILFKLAIHWCIRILIYSFKLFGIHPNSNKSFFVYLCIKPNLFHSFGTQLYYSKRVLNCFELLFKGNVLIFLAYDEVYEWHSFLVCLVHIDAGICRVIYVDRSRTLLARAQKLKQLFQKYFEEWSISVFGVG